MGTFTDVFERKEVKYRLSASQHAAMLSALDGHLVPDIYGLSRIVSLYLDTPDRLLVERSLDKPLYKEKLRLRSYGLPSELDRVFIEIKKKFDGIVYKRRVGMSYAAARAYLGGLSYERACGRYPLPDSTMAAESTSQRSTQIAREIDHFLRAYGSLRASMIIDCERTAYVPVRKFFETDEAVEAFGSSAMPETLEVLKTSNEPETSDDLRITFDTSILCKDMFVGESLSSFVPLIDSGEAIMEIKSAGPFPLWLVRALAVCEAYPSSFSKYGEAYKVAMKNKASISAIDAASERMAFESRDTHRRSFRASAQPIKKEGCCA
ncbi:MAG: polyphosphate polymerase domain-containing protein [Gordonibacter sp.]|nr:polyphosphate polymerase domain-containing protein [Gordonibacter sp.]